MSEENKESVDKTYIISKIIDAIVIVLRLVIVWGVIAYIAHTSGNVFIEYAGKYTIALVNLKASVAATGSAQIDINTCEDLGVIPDIWFWAIVAVLGLSVIAVSFGLRQRSLRQRIIRRYSKYIADKERDSDPNRSSSGLARHGGTHPGDE